MTTLLNLDLSLFSCDSFFLFLFLSLSFSLSLSLSHFFLFFLYTCFKLQHQFHCQPQLNFPEFLSSFLPQVQTTNRESLAEREGRQACGAQCHKMWRDIPRKMIWDTYAWKREIEKESKREGERERWDIKIYAIWHIMNNMLWHLTLMKMYLLTYASCK
jgi:hypothetical protein